MRTRRNIIVEILESLGYDIDDLYSDNDTFLCIGLDELDLVELYMRIEDEFQFDYYYDESEKIFKLDSTISTVLNSLEEKLGKEMLPAKQEENKLTDFFAL